MEFHEFINSQEWINDCLKWRHVRLTGGYSHYCYEWDGLPVDETTPEFEACLCFSDHPNVKNR